MHEEPSEDSGGGPGSSELGPDAALLREFLSNRDATCPACGYNVRDATGEKCPECGDALVLDLAARGGFRPRSAVLALLLLWLLVAGAMNTTRAIRDVQRWTSTAQIIWQLKTTPIPGSIPSSIPPTTDVVVESVQTPASSVSAPTIVAQGPGTIQQGRTATTLTAPTINVVMQRPGSGGSLLAAVPWHRWVNLGWWSILTLAAAFGLVLVVITRRRRMSRRVTRTLVTITSLGFAGYLAHQVYDFVAGIS